MIILGKNTKKKKKLYGFLLLQNKNSGFFYFLVLWRIVFRFTNKGKTINGINIVYIKEKVILTNLLL